MLCILCFGAWHLLGDSMDTYPAFVHAWTQSDRLAIAMNFQQNGFDFFHPATFNLLTKGGITQVDFPIHDYAVACISSFLKTDVVLVFRSYNLLYSLLGLFFFFRLSLIHLSAKRAVFLTTFLFTLPFFVYYQNGFLPSAPSFSNFLIGLYYLEKSRVQGAKKEVLLGVFFLTLAALARSPFAIFLFAYLGNQLWQFFQKKKVDWAKVLLPSVGIAIVLGYFLYNQYLAKTYGSMFLSELLAFRSFGDFIEVIGIAADRWGKELLSPFHLMMLLALLAAYTKQSSRPFSLSSLLSFPGLSSLGVLLYFFLFGKQFADHDYYYLDGFLPLLAMVSIQLLKSLQIPNSWYTTIGTISIVFFFYFFSYAKGVQEDRYTAPFDDRTAYAYSVYKTSKKDIAQWGIEEADTLLVLEANTTNMPFTLGIERGILV